jgi:hypothetical protein
MFVYFFQYFHLNKTKFKLFTLKISSIEDFWFWSINKLSLGLRANVWYNGQQPFGLAGYLNDFSSRMIGYATLRQLRVKNSNAHCYVFFFNKYIYF